jgi:hypothetical protein
MAVDYRPEVSTGERGNRNLVAVRAIQCRDVARMTHLISVQVETIDPVMKDEAD